MSSLELGTPDIQEQTLPLGQGNGTETTPPDTIPPSSGERLHDTEDQLDAFRLQISQNREAHPEQKTVIVVSDLDDLASGQVAASIREQGPKGDHFHVAEFNGVHPYNVVSAAHTLAALLSDKKNFPAGTIFVVVVDPHVGQNGSNGQNVADKRAVVQYEDGTVIVSPARSYVRVGEFHGRGKIVRAAEIDKDRLIRLGLTENNGNDVFDGLRRFGPAAAAILHKLPVDAIGEKIDPETLPELEIPEGTISDIEPNYQNIRVEIPYDRFPIGTKLAVKNSEGRLLCIAERKQAFEGQKGDIVAVNGSKYLLKDGGKGKKGIYLGAVQGKLAEILGDKYGHPVSVGDSLSVQIATLEELSAFESERTLREVKDAVKDAADALCGAVQSKVERILAHQADVHSIARGIASRLRNAAQWLRS